MASANERYGNNPTGNNPGGTVQAAKSNIAAVASATGEQLSDVAGQAQQAAKDQLDKLADSIRRNPIQSTGIAAGVGFLLALIARR